jgi:hypothetical protein
MANGTAVALPVELDPPSKPTELDEIGTAVAAAAIAIAGGCGQFTMLGRLTAETKMMGAQALARVSMLMLAHFGDDAEFADIAYREGAKALWQHHGFREYAAQLDPTMREHMFGEFLRGALEIAGKAVADERARAQH